MTFEVPESPKPPASRRNTVKKVMFGWSDAVFGSRVREATRSLLSTRRTTCAAAEMYTTAWCKHSPHVPRNLCARACQLSLDCSLRHTQHLSCLKDRETVDDA